MSTIPEAWVADENSHHIVRSDEEISIFADGAPVAICTSWAIQARRILGDRIAIYGFFCDDNPEAIGMARLAGGHDFAVLDGRWILDGWLAHMEAEIDDPVIDMTDPSNEALIRTFYGSQLCWQRGSDIEQATDNEPAETRRRAMSGLIRDEAPCFRPQGA